MSKYEYVITPPEAGKNAIPLWQDALAAVKSAGGGKIIFAPGRYDFFPEGCSQRYCYFSNNDEGVKTIALDIVGVNDLSVEGCGAEFCFYGRVSPLVAVHCRNLRVAGFTVDFADSFVSDADLAEESDGIAWFRIGGQHRFENGKLIFTGDFYDNMSGKLLFYPFDTEKNEFVWDAHAVNLSNSQLLEKDGLIGFRHDFSGFPTRAFIIKHELRLCPGMVFDNCTDVDLTGVSVHHAAGMGVLFQQSDNINISKLQVVPRGRRTSASDDALHLTECRGNIHISDSIFAGTLDDSINIHSVYRPLKERIPGGHFYYLDTGHYQQSGLAGARPGDTLELVKNDTGKPYGKLKLTNAVLLNKAITKVEFDPAELPEEFVPGDCARVLESANAEVIVENCRFSTVNGRGILAAGMKKAIIRNNFFHTSGAAIFVSGDTVFWYEAGPVGEMEIYGNTFDHCCYRRWGATREIVSVFPEISTAVPGFSYHGRICVRNNVFRSPFRMLVSMKNTAHAEVVDNRFVIDDSRVYMPGSESGYFFADMTPEQVAFMDCPEVVVKNNGLL